MNLNLEDQMLVCSAVITSKNGNWYRWLTELTTDWRLVLKTNSSCIVQLVCKLLECSNGLKKKIKWEQHFLFDFRRIWDPKITVGQIFCLICIIPLAIWGRTEYRLSISRTHFCFSFGLLRSCIRGILCLFPSFLE